MDTLRPGKTPFHLLKPTYSLDITTNDKHTHTHTQDDGSTRTPHFSLPVFLIPPPEPTCDDSRVSIPKRKDVKTSKGSGGSEGDYSGTERLKSMMQCDLERRPVLNHRHENSTAHSRNGDVECSNRCCCSRAESERGAHGS